MGSDGGKETMSQTETSKGSSKSWRLVETLGKWKEVTEGKEVRKARWGGDKLRSFWILSGK